MIARVFRLVVIALLTGAITGCGGATSSVEATGSVEMDGSPLTNATVQFIPTSEAKLGTHSATTDADGKFTLRSVAENLPLKPGSYVVVINKMSGNSMDNMKNEVPDRYRNQQSTPFKADIVEGRNELPPFQMTTKQMR